MAKFYVDVQIKLVIVTDDITEAINEMDYTFLSGQSEEGSWDIVDHEMVDYQITDVK